MSYLDVHSVARLRKNILDVCFNGTFPLVIPSAPSNLVEYMDTLQRSDPDQYKRYTTALLKLFRTTERAIERIIFFTPLSTCRYGLSNLALYGAIIRGSEINDHMDVACRLNTAVRAFSIMASIRRMLDYEAKTYRGRLPSRALRKWKPELLRGIPNSGYCSL